MPSKLLESRVTITPAVHLSSLPGHQDWLLRGIDLLPEVLISRVLAVCQSPTVFPPCVACAALPLPRHEHSHCGIVIAHESLQGV